jgi:hypothetical protein
VDERDAAGISDLPAQVGHEHLQRRRGWLDTVLGAVRGGQQTQPAVAQEGAAKRQRCTDAVNSDRGRVLVPHRPGPGERGGDAPRLGLVGLAEISRQVRLVLPHGSRPGLP